jgi:uncharacterized protein (DUF433 family)
MKREKAKGKWWLAFSSVSPYHDVMRLILDDADLQQLPITIDPEIVSGTPVFCDTRVPVEALITNLEGGMSLEEFLENFPSVSREQAVQVLEFHHDPAETCRRILKILLDESVPRLVKNSLPSWTITTVQELGWSSMKNGELLARANEQGFTILITADRNLRYQQSALVNSRYWCSPLTVRELSGHYYQKLPAHSVVCTQAT